MRRAKSSNGLARCGWVGIPLSSSKEMPPQIPTSNPGSHCISFMDFVINSGWDLGPRKPDMMPTPSFNDNIT
jgi:hypothetical protein